MQPTAADALSYACNHCHKDARRQKMRILQFLIPVQMLLGKLPSAAIRQKYNMHTYDESFALKPATSNMQACFEPFIVHMQLHASVQGLDPI